jgi:hypothetical protein
MSEGYGLAPVVVGEIPGAFATGQKHEPPRGRHWEASGCGSAASYSDVASCVGSFTAKAERLDLSFEDSNRIYYEFDWADDR